MTIFALVDCNNFFCSCERVFNPKLHKKPVAILSNNDGCIIARSNEVKALNIPMGAPYFKYKEHLIQNNVHVFSSNYVLYGDMSKRVMASLNSFSDDVEIYSIDEAFLRLDHITQQSSQYARIIQQCIQQWTGIPISIGIGPTKTLAKLANQLAKQSSGIYNLCHPSQQHYIAGLPIDMVWGIGKNMAIRLRHHDIRTIGQLLTQDPRWIRQVMTIRGLQLVQELQGKPYFSTQKDISKKSIIRSKSFGKSMTQSSMIAQAIANYCAHAAHDLRKQQHLAQAITVYIRTNRHRKNGHYFGKKITIRFDQATDHTPTIIRYANIGLHTIFRKGYDYHKAGIALLDLVPNYHIQDDLFSSMPKQSHLCRIMDQINAKMGKDVVKFAAQGRTSPWKGRCKHRSPAYTTDWTSLPNAYTDHKQQKGYI